MSDKITEKNSDTVKTLLEENRLFEVNEEFKNNARIKDETIYDEASKNREAFWAKQAENLDWYQKWDKVLEWKAPFAKWFIGGQVECQL